MERLDHSLACMLMGFDGIQVESVIRPETDLDLELMGAEISAIVNQLRQAAFISQFGTTKEFVLRSDQTTILLSVLTIDYFLALVMGPDAHVGKGRFLLRSIESELIREL